MLALEQQPGMNARKLLCRHYETVRSKKGEHHVSLSSTLCSDMGARCAVTWMGFSRYNHYAPKLSLGYDNLGSGKHTTARL
jgi:hypothetical protein